MSAVTHAEIVAQMRAALQLSDPDVDTTVGTTTRKIIDVVGEMIAEVYMDRYLLTYQYDIDAKTGEDLDDFVRLFGFTRFPAKRATGMVTFERTVAATAEILIPVATQLSTEGMAPVLVQTTTPALLNVGDTSISVPVQAVVGGAAGNVTANGLRRITTSLVGINSFTNVAALTGGADAEDDEQLRTRFKRTVFRSMAGTEQMFLGTALDDPAVTQANVLGAAKRWRERIQLVAGTATTTITDERYIYPDSQVFGVNIDIGDILTPGVHYEFDSETGEVTSLDAGEVPDGIYDLEFEYVSVASRNDPANGLTNRIDIYINGERPTEASEVVIFDEDRVFVNDVNSPLHYENFEKADGSNPAIGSYLVPFAFAPVMDSSIDDEITIGGNDYVEDTDYFLVNDITNEGGTPTSLSGIEIIDPPTPVIADGEAFQVSYIFNAVPRDVSIAVKAWRLVTTDVQVHQARKVLLNLHMAIMYSPGYNEASVRPELEKGLERYISTVGFNGVVQVSDLLEVAHRTPGVDAVRFLTDADSDTAGGTEYAIQRVAADGTILETYDNNGTPERAVDVLVGDDEYPVFNELILAARAQNTFGSV